MQIIQYYITQNKPLPQLSSCPVKTDPTKKILYRTESEIKVIENIRFEVLQHHKTGRKSSASFLLKILAGRKEKLGRFSTRQSVLGSEILQYGYDKVLCPKQIGRVMKQLSEAKLITYKRKCKRMNSPNQFEVTQLGMDVFHYIINANLGDTRIKILKLEDEMVDEKATEIDGCKKNVPYISISGDKIHNHMVHTSERLKNEDQKPPDVPFVSKINLNAPPIDLDDPHRIYLCAEPCLETYESRSTINLTRVYNPVEGKKPVSLPNNTGLTSKIFNLVRGHFFNDDFTLLKSFLECINDDEKDKEIFVKALNSMKIKILSEGRKVVNFRALAKSIAYKTLSEDSAKKLSTVFIGN